MNKKTFNIGPIRPPSEAHSLLLQVTKGCTWNKCKFCDLYRNTGFSFTPLEEMKETIDIISYYRDRIYSFKLPGGRLNHEKIVSDINSFPAESQNSYYMVYNWLSNGGKSAFLQDANTMALKPDYLIELLVYLKNSLPEIERITSYGRADSLARISPDQYVALKEAGLNRIHSGFESGSDEVLALINKGITSEIEIEAGRNIVQSGIELSIYFMPGVGGKELSEKNAVETAKVINAVNPHFVRLRTAVIKEGTELRELVDNKKISPCTDIDKVEEIALMIENIKDCSGTLLSDHIVNLLPEIEGSLKHDRSSMLNTAYEFLALPDREKKLFQLARRAGLLNKLSDIKRLGSDTVSRINGIIDATVTDEEWEDIVNHYLVRYI